MQLGADQTSRVLEDDRTKSKENALSAMGELPEEPKTLIEDPLSVDTVIVHYDRELEQREMDETFRRHRRAMSDLSGTTSPRVDDFPPDARAAEKAAVKWEKTTLKHQIAGLRERFREALAEANATRDALDGYKDTVQRVEFQKRLLCAQVLELEASLAEKEEESARVAERARERERELLERAKAGARLSRQPDSWAGCRRRPSSCQRLFDCGTSSGYPFGTAHSSSSRSGGRETFYFEAEYRRLAWLKESLVTAAGWRVPDDDDGRRSVGTEEIAALPPSLREAERKLARERRYLRGMARRLGAAPVGGHIHPVGNTSPIEAAQASAREPAVE